MFVGQTDHTALNFHFCLVDYQSYADSCSEIKPKAKTLLFHAEFRTADYRVQELRDSRGGRPGLSVLHRPNGLCGGKATLNLNSSLTRCSRHGTYVLRLGHVTSVFVYGVRFLQACLLPLRDGNDCRWNKCYCHSVR